MSLIKIKESLVLRDTDISEGILTFTTCDHIHISSLIHALSSIDLIFCSSNFMWMRKDSIPGFNVHKIILMTRNENYILIEIET